MIFQPPKSFYESLFDNMIDGAAYCHMIFDEQHHPIDFTYVEVNKNFEKLTGLKKVKGKRVTEVIPGIRTSNPELFEIYGKVSLAGKPQRFEMYIAPISRWFLISVYSPQRGYFTAAFQNITTQKRIEEDLESAKIAARNVLEDLQTEKETLAHAKAKDEAMLASIGDGVVIVDLEDKITFINQSAQSMLGWKSTEIIDRLLHVVIPIEDEKGVVVSAQARSAVGVSAAGIPVREEKHASSTTKVTPVAYYYTRKDKTKFPVAMNFSRVVLEDKIVGAIEVFRDITREKEIDKAKSEFVSLASHQLRTPLGIMKWYLEALESEEYFKKAPLAMREYLDEIHRSNERVLVLVRDLLSVSRIDQGRVKNTPVALNLMQEIRSIVKQVRIVARKKGVLLHLAMQGGEASILIDSSRFCEVINNLIINAIEYTEVGGTVDVIVKKHHNTLFVSVKDTGIGISEVDQKKLFTKFFRSEKAVKHNPEGSGLGLYVVKSYVEGWGGEISIESVEGRGSTFLISIPISVQKKEGRGNL